MSLLGIDIGGTKILFAAFDSSGSLLVKKTDIVRGAEGKAAAEIILAGAAGIISEMESLGNPVRAAGISIPGIYRRETGSVWAPNIPGWEDYPLEREVEKITGNIPLVIDNDRACSILGEFWKGNAQGCSDVVFLAFGTGIGAGIISGGRIIRGKNDIAGATGWMALNPAFEDKYTRCGCLEYWGSGDGMARTAIELMEKDKGYEGVLATRDRSNITSEVVFSAYDNGDPLAAKTIDICVVYWGMAIANFISIFNPEKIILGGGLFGPASRFIDRIKSEAVKWAQPVSAKTVKIEIASLGSVAAATGAAYLAHQHLNNVKDV
ncbi:MAG: ROK family protein [Bacteroidales bacterium]